MSDEFLPDINDSKFPFARRSTLRPQSLIFNSTQLQTTESDEQTENESEEIKNPQQKNHSFPFTSSSSTDQYATTTAAATSSSSKPQVNRQQSNIVKTKKYHLRYPLRKGHSLPQDLHKDSVRLNILKKPLNLRTTDLPYNHVKMGRITKKDKHSTLLTQLGLYHPEKMMSIIQCPDISHGIVGLGQFVVSRLPISPPSQASIKKIVNDFQIVIESEFGVVSCSHQMSLTESVTKDDSEIFTYEEDDNNSETIAAADQFFDETKIPVVVNCLRLLSRHIFDPASLQEGEYNRKMENYLKLMDTQKSQTSSVGNGYDGDITDTSSDLSTYLTLSPNESSPMSASAFSSSLRNRSTTQPNFSEEISASTSPSHHLIHQLQSVRIRDKSYNAEEHDSYKRRSQPELESKSSVQQPTNSSTPPLYKRIHNRGKIYKHSLEMEIASLTDGLHKSCNIYDEFEKEMDKILFDKKRTISWREITLLYYITRKLIRRDLMIASGEDAHSRRTLVPNDEPPMSIHSWLSTLYSSNISSNQLFKDDDPQIAAEIAALFKSNENVQKWCDYALRYFEDHFAKWVLDQGGLEAILDIGTDLEID